MNNLKGNSPNVNGRTVFLELYVSLTKLDGDQVSNLKYHGGDNRWIHHYATECYDYLNGISPDKANKDYCKFRSEINISKFLFKFEFKSIIFKECIVGDRPMKASMAANEGSLFHNPKRINYGRFH